MTDETTHEDNATPEATDDDIKRMDADTPGQGDASPGASVDQGPGADGPVGGGDVEENDDPKEGAGNTQVKADH